MTVGTVGALTILVFEAWGMFLQTKKIWDDKSAGVLSVHWFGYVAGFMLACIPYGIVVKSGTIVIAAAVFFLFHIPILWGIYTFRGFTKHEWFGLGCYSLMLPAMVWLPWIDAVYLACSLGTVWAFVTQPWKMWQEKSAGEVEIKMVVVFLVSVTFWALYAFAIDAIALMVLNPLLFMILTVTIVLWFTYRGSTPATT